MKHKKPRTSSSLAMVRSYFPQVTTLVDAKRRAIIEVTPVDNANSDVRSHRTCALALACKRFFNADGVIIGLTTSWVIHGKVATRYHNAATISREITSFDRNAGFDEGEYLLTPAPKTSLLGAPRSKDPRRPSKGGASRSSFRHFTRNVRTSLHAKIV